MSRRYYTIEELPWHERADFYAGHIPRPQQFGHYYTRRGELRFVKLPKTRVTVTVTIERRRKKRSRT